MKSVIFLALYALFLIEVSILPTKVRAIFEGRNVEEARWYPHMCGIVRIRDDNETHNPCGCAIISPSYALTSADCFNETWKQHKRYTLFAGSLNFNEGETRDILKETDVLVHPNFNNSGKLLADSNIALIQIVPQLNFNESVQSIQLGGPDDCKAIDGFGLNDHIDLKYKITGWGINKNYPKGSHFDRYSKNLLWDAALPGRRTKCEELYSSKGYDHDKNSCSEYGSGACIGDSGSPWVFYNHITKSETHSGEYLCGLIGYGDNDCSLKNILFTRISYYMPWICKHAENEPAGCKELEERKKSCIFYKPL